MKKEKKAGMDCGNTRTKFRFVLGGRPWYTTVPSEDIGSVITFLYAEGVRRIYRTGIGPGPQADIPSDLYIIPAMEGSPVHAELEVQARGMRCLLDGALEEFLLVTIGTGVSYTLSRGDGIIHLRPGNPLAGGHILGAAYSQGVMNIADVDVLVRQGKDLDLRLADVMPELQGKPEGLLVVGHFGKMKGRPSVPDFLATAVHEVATGVARDLWRGWEGISLPKAVVFGGGATASFGSLRVLLGHYVGRFLEKSVYFPPHAEYAGAVGAYYSHP